MALSIVKKQQPELFRQAFCPDALKLAYKKVTLWEKCQKPMAEQWGEMGSHRQTSPCPAASAS